MNTTGTDFTMLLLLAKSVLICLVFLGIGCVFRRSSAAALRMWWKGAVVSLFAVTVASFGPALWRLPLRAEMATQALPSMQMESGIQDIPAPAVDTRLQADTTSPSSFHHAGVLAGKAFLLLWAGGAVLMLCRFGLAMRRVNQIVKRARAATNLPEFATHNTELLRLSGNQSVALLVSDEVQSPFAAGFIRCVIVLPWDAESCSPEECRAILRHELAHVENRDVVWQSIASVISALLWVNPLVKSIHSKLLKAQEGAADDAVLDEGVDSLAYAATLSNIAARLRGLPAVCPAAPMARQSTLGWRVARILDRSQRRGAIGPIAFGTAVTLTTAVIAALGFAGFQAKAADAERSGSASDQTAYVPKWTRKYRDTFQLTQKFTDHFKGTPEEAVTEFRKELAAIAGDAVSEIQLELSPDKRALTVEFSEKRSKEIESALLRLLRKFGWEEEFIKDRQQQADRALQPFRDEVDKQRAIVEQRWAEAAKLREDAKIVDPNLEKPTSNVTIPDPDSPSAKATLSRYFDAKARYIQAKKILEAAEVRCSTAMMEGGIGNYRD